LGALALSPERQSAQMSKIKTGMALNGLNSKNSEQLALKGLM